MPKRKNREDVPRHSGAVARWLRSARSASPIGAALNSLMTKCARHACEPKAIDKNGVVRQDCPDGGLEEAGGGADFRRPAESRWRRPSGPQRPSQRATCAVCTARILPLLGELSWAVGSRGRELRRELHVEGLADTEVCIGGRRSSSRSASRVDATGPFQFEIPGSSDGYDPSHCAEHHGE